MLSDLQIFQTLKSRMQFHQARQGVLAQNIANADTPGYDARDIKMPDFGEALRMASLKPTATSASHMGVSMARLGERYKAGDDNAWEVTPNGNGVVLEDQMVRIAENQMEYQTATTLYSRALGLLRLAVGGNR